MLSASPHTETTHGLHANHNTRRHRGYGNRLDIGDNESKIRTMRRSMTHNQTDKRATDRSQDQAIAALQGEVDDLKIAFGAIGNLLVDKGVVPAAADRGSRRAERSLSRRRRG